MNTPDHNAEAVLAFWFAAVGDDGAAVMARNSVWYRSDADFDAEIRTRFGALVEAAARGELEDWTRTARGTLALLLVCDQFPRNIFRGTPRAFALDPRAQTLALDGVARGVDRTLGIAARSFFYLPFEHAEDRALQAQSLRCFEQLDAEAAPDFKAFTADALHWARDHYEIVMRFGRFPHRNAALARVATPEESAFLAAGANHYGQA